MREKTSAAVGSVTERVRQIADIRRVGLTQIGACAAGYIMANSILFGGPAPFGVALSAALPWKFVTPAALGSVIAYLFAVGHVGNITHIAAVMLVIAIKWLLSWSGSRLNEGIASVLCAFLAMSIASFIVLMVGAPTFYHVLSAVAAVFLCSGAAYFFSRTIGCMSAGFSGASRLDISCVVMSFAIIVMGFSSITIAGVSSGRIIAAFVILIAARYGREPGGAVAGITAGIAMGLAGGDFAYTVTAYAFGGLVAGVFGYAGRLPAAASFVIINALAAVFSGADIEAYSAVVEIFVASVAFMAIPNGVIKRLKLLPSVGQSGQNDAARQAIRARVDDISRTLLYIGKTTQEINRRLGGGQRGGGFSEIYPQVVARVCKRCGMRDACWQENRTATMDALADSVRVMRRDGVLGREQTPSYLTRSCCKLDAMINELNAQFRLGISREDVARKARQVRCVVSDQFEGMSMILDDISLDLSTRKMIPADKSRRVRDYFERQSLNPTEVSCYQSSRGETHIELRLPPHQLGRIEKLKMALDLSSLLDVEFDTPILDEGENECLAVFSEKSQFTLTAGAFQISSGKGAICGDAYDILHGGSGRRHLIISDGMGSGGGAAVDSVMATSLIGKLLGVGVGHEAALKMVNSALLIKSGEESLATIDVCTIDLFSGSADFYKAGAAPTYILRDGEPKMVQSTSLPAGILHGVAFEKSSLTLTAGDLIMMVSDGVTTTGTGWLLSELKSLGCEDVQYLCESLAATAAIRRQDNHTDDITVLAVRLDRNS